MRNFTLAVAVIGAVSCLGTMANATPTNLVLNGDFSQSSYAVNSQFGSQTGTNGGGFSYGGQGVTNWTGNDGYMLYMYGNTSTTQSANSRYDNGYGTGLEKLWGPVAGITPPGGGNNFVVLDGDQTAGIQAAITQTIIGLIPGMTYQLNFDWGAGQLQSRNGATTEQFQVTFGNETQSTAVAANPEHSFSGWMGASMAFTADATSQALTFLSVGMPTGLPPVATLANISMSQVPEPMTLALLGSGLVGLVVARRHKRRA